MDRQAFIKGEKIDLYPIEEEDLERFRDILNQETVRIPLGTYLPQNKESEKEWFEDWLDDDSRITLAIYHKEDEKIIGNIGLNIKDQKSRFGEFGYFLDEEYHSQGIGTEASKLVLDYYFNQLNLHKVVAKVYEFNQKSQGLLKKLGFRQEARMVDQRFIDGEYVDVIWFGLLREEWKKN